MTSGVIPEDVDWPTLDELKQMLDVGETDVWDGEATSSEGMTRLTALLTAAIDIVKDDIGDWDEDTDYPDTRLAKAALTMAVLLAQKPGMNAGDLRKDPTYAALMVGKHNVFGIA